MCTYITLGSVSRKTQTVAEALRADPAGTQRIGYVKDTSNPANPVCYYVWDFGVFSLENAGIEGQIVLGDPPPELDCREF